MSDPEEAVEVTTPAGSVKVRGTDIMSVITMVCMLSIAFFVYGHGTDTKNQNTTLAIVLKDLSDAQKEQAKSQKLMACILSRPEAERKKEFESPNSFCQQITRP